MLNVKTYNKLSFDEKAELIGLFAEYQNRFKLDISSNKKLSLYKYYDINIVVVDEIKNRSIPVYFDSYAIYEYQIPETFINVIEEN